MKLFQSSSKLLLVIFTIIVAGVLLLYLFQHVNGSQGSSTQQGQTGILVTEETLTDASASIKYEINEKYPQFSGLLNTEDQLAVNNATKEVVTTLANEFKKTLDTSERIPLPSDLANTPNTLTTTYEVIRADDRIISIQFSVSEYSVGAAHPNNYNQTFNYSLVQHKVLEMADLFKQGSNYPETLSTLAKADLFIQFKDDPYAKDFINPGAAPDAKNFQKFVIDKTHLILVFDPYQVGPYVAGTRTVAIPFDNLNSILNTAILP